MSLISVMAFLIILVLYIHFRVVSVDFVYTFLPGKQMPISLEARRQLLSVQVATSDLLPQSKQEVAGVVYESVPIHARVLLTLKVYPSLQPRGEATTNRLCVVVPAVHGLLLCTLGRYPWLPTTGYGRVVNSVCLVPS